MKKFLILLVSLLFMGLYAHASLDSTLDKINNVFDKVDRTEYTINRAKRRLPTIPQTTTGYPNTQTTTSPTYQQSSPNYNSGNQYQYQQDTDYDNMPTQQQTAEQEPAIQQGQQYSQDRVFKGQASTLGELPAGVIVIDPKSVWNYRNGDNYSGAVEIARPVSWRKLEDNHYADGTTLLLAENRVAAYPFCHVGKGLRAWDESDVRRFLRTTFYTHLSEGFKTAIVNVNIPFADLNGNPKTVNDNFFLLSIVEWGLSDRANNGSVIKYDNLPEIYMTPRVWYDKDRDQFWEGVSRETKTRTINRPEAKSAGFTNDVFYVSDGTLGTDWFASNNSYVRPAVNLKSSTKVSGPYELTYNLNKKLIYYALEF